MKNISKRSIIVAIIVLALAVGAALLFILRPSSPNKSEDAASSTPSDPQAVAGQAVKDMAFKEPDASSKRLELTKPTEELPGPKKSPVTKVFDLRIENGAYSLPQIVVKNGDHVQFRFTAIGSDQDIVMAAPVGAYLMVKQNEASIFGFIAEKAGTYEFGCDKACPSGSKVVGKLIIQ